MYSKSKTEIKITNLTHTHTLCISFLFERLQNFSCNSEAIVTMERNQEHMATKNLVSSSKENTRNINILATNLDI